MRYYTVTPKRPKILKIVEFLMNKFFGNDDTVTLFDTALFEIFDGHLKDGRRHGMDTYLFLK
jgi:hypothetical protein